MFVAYLHFARGGRIIFKQSDDPGKAAVSIMLPHHFQIAWDVRNLNILLFTGTVY